VTRINQYIGSEVQPTTHLTNFVRC